MMDAYRSASCRSATAAPDQPADHPLDQLNQISQISPLYRSASMMDAYRSASCRSATVAPDPPACHPLDQLNQISHHLRLSSQISSLYRSASMTDAYRSARSATVAPDHDHPLHQVSPVYALRSAAVIQISQVRSAC